MSEVFKKNKVIVASLYYKPYYGGVENSLYYISKSLIRKGCVVEILASNRTPSGGVINDSVDDIIKINRFKYPRYTLSIFKPLMIILSVLSALNRLKVDKDAIILCRNHLVVLGFYLYGIKNITYIVPSLIDGLDTKFNKDNISFLELIKKSLIQFLIVSQSIVIQKIAFSYSRKIVVFSNMMRNQILSKYNSVRPKVSVISPGVDRSRFNRLSLDLDSINTCDNHRITFLCMARLAESKGYNDVVDAMELLDEGVLHRIRVLIVGDGPEKLKLETKVEKLKLGSVIKFYPSTTEPEKYYKMSDYFFMTSRYESFGQTIIESFSSGVPVLAYNSESIDTASSEIISHGYNGFLCDLNNYDLAALISRVVSIRKHDKELINLNCIETSKKYSWDRFVEMCINS
ncbi:glycosyltransferase family 4 protein [Halosquirtibacter xylanolyticus]|uniref:glycosyltransferase family 4 protein n=1 Tax=Halosquirtibacter xylanolyticus TaxID=3374599 RepID=UPI003749E516|nr:glycosyltransferase family 4 protein [Prolixibacteraceae bacterium]